MFWVVKSSFNPYHFKFLFTSKKRNSYVSNKYYIEKGKKRYMLSCQVFHNHMLISLRRLGKEIGRYFSNWVSNSSSMILPSTFWHMFTVFLVQLGTSFVKWQSLLTISSSFVPFPKFPPSYRWINMFLIIMRV